MKRSTLVRVGTLSSIIVIVVVFLSVFLSKQSDEDDEPTTRNVEVSTVSGTIRGSTTTTSKNRTIYAFKGIPFAEPPIGELRFAAPVAKRSWSRIFDATQDGQQCPQLSGEGFVGDEDCLHLNVYTPLLPLTHGNVVSLPVMVFVYGGAFSSGSNNSTRYGPGYLLDKDVVLVVPNYRVGLFGFLTTGDETAPGNNGLKDLLLALEWIRDNVRNFGGDPEKVTVVGQSAGGAATHLLALSKRTRGLFRGYATLSGAAGTFWAQEPETVGAALAHRLGTNAGCRNDTSVILVDCLRRLNTSRLMEASVPLYLIPNILPPVLWKPTVEPDFEGAFLSMTAAEAYASGAEVDLPSINGLVESEGMVKTGYFYANPERWEYFFGKFDKHFPEVLSSRDPNVNLSGITAAVKSYFLGNDLTRDYQIMLSNITDATSDLSWNYPVKIALENRVKNSTSPVYAYLFAYRGTFSYSYDFTNGLTKDFGAVHGDDTLYLFPQNEVLFGSLNLEPTTDDLSMKDIMVEIFASFVIDGKPSIAGRNATWNPFSPRDENYLKIGGHNSLEIDVGYAFRKERMKFWREFFTGASSS